MDLEDINSSSTPDMSYFPELQFGLTHVSDEEVKLIEQVMDRHALDSRSDYARRLLSRPFFSGLKKWLVDFSKRKVPAIYSGVDGETTTYSQYSSDYSNYISRRDAGDWNIVEVHSWLPGTKNLGLLEDIVALPNINMSEKVRKEYETLKEHLKK